MTMANDFAVAITSHKVAAKTIRNLRNTLRCSLREILPVGSSLRCYVSERNIWEERLVESKSDVVAYVSLARYKFQWNFDVVPVTPMPSTSDDQKIIQSVADKLVELGFTIDKYNVVNNGNVTCWRVVAPS